MYYYPPVLFKESAQPKEIILFTLSHVKQYDFSFIPRATPAFHSTSHASLTSQNGFASAFLHMMLRRAKRLIKA
jgi:hypothetical protein